MASGWSVLSQLWFFQDGAGRTLGRGDRMLEGAGRRLERHRAGHDGAEGTQEQQAGTEHGDS